MILASSAAAVVLATAPALASAHYDDDSSKSNKSGLFAKADLNFGSFFHKGDKDKDKHDDKHASSTRDGVDKEARNRAFLAAVGMEAGGVVTSINGSTLTIKPFGTKATTTTVTANGSTTYKVNGQAASSTDLTVGSHVLVDGTATSDTSVTASLISIFNAGIGFFKHLWSH